ncbi:hypothetical protein [Kitasatospora paranensis]|uniref:Uncharacterized protein n=1 Tax=Kitasatospora paranensis TaxID=258053 RepID=A0ABW2FWF2_9ACTN
MSRETALLESRTLRRSMCERVDVLDKVKALVLLPDGLHVTTRMVADYFEVGERAINAVIHRHRAELDSNGLTVVHRSAKDQVTQGCNVQLSPNGGRSLALWPRRAVLNVAMLLRDSEVARNVRRHLLDVEERASAGRLDHAALLADAERRVLDGEVGRRLGACERMVLADRALVRAMSARLCEAAHDLRELRADVAEIRGALAALAALGGGTRDRRWGRGR